MQCPICKKPVADDEPNQPAAYPFCCDRCKLIDLGRWLDGKYAVPVSKRADQYETEDEQR